jgi:hypothetical protein
MFSTWVDNFVGKIEAAIHQTSPWTGMTTYVKQFTATIHHSLSSLFFSLLFISTTLAIHFED